jgi:plastocyanin
MRRSILTFPLALALAAVLIAGCGGGSSSSTTTKSTATPAPASGGSASSSGPVAVSMKDISFAPKSVSVKVGQKITWTNDDTVDHNVTSQSGEHIASSNFGKGGTFSFTPTKAGTISYVCTIHPGMDGTIVVTQ